MNKLSKTMKDKKKMKVISEKDNAGEEVEISVFGIDVRFIICIS